MNKNLRATINTLIGGLFGFIIGYVIVLYVLLLFFGSRIENVGVVFFSMFFGILYGLALGNLHSYHPKYVNKYCISFASIGMIIATITSMFLQNIKGVFIIGFPVFFGILGVFLDKKIKNKK